MTVSEVRNELLRITQTYFSGATVRIGKQSFTPKPKGPLVTMTTGPVQRPLNPPTILMDGKPVSFYPATMPVQIDLYTNGKQTVLAKGTTPIIENTAEDDMLAFMSYLNSAYVIDRCREKDIAIIVPGTAQDLTGLINDTNYQFRAMAEITVYFTMVAAGHTGTLDIDGHVSQATPSGGGGPALEQAESGGGCFTAVEINDKPIRKEDSNES